MKTLILGTTIAVMIILGIIIGLSEAIEALSADTQSDYAQNEWLRTTPVCVHGTLDTWAAKSVRMGAVEHALSADEVETVIRVLYHDYQTPTQARLFTLADRIPAVAFGDARGCYMNRIRPTLDWINRILHRDRDIVHPATS